MTPELLDVWVVDLEAPRLETPALQALLASNELARARRFHFDRDRERFVRGRGVARSILAGYLGRNPAELIIGEGPNGKPELEEKAPAFNISHSGPVFVLAVHAVGPVGIDVELPNAIDDLNALAATVFSEREQGQFSRVPERERLSVFYHAWTLKEAVLKYLGHGFSTPPTDIHIDFGTGPTPSLERVDSRDWVPEQARVIGPIALPSISAAHDEAICHSVVPTPATEIRVRVYPPPA